MLDIGWPELLVVLVVAVMVIGPRDLPKAMYTLGKWVRAARRVTGQMQKHFDEAMREAELEDVRKGLQNASKLNVKKQIESHVDPKGQLGKAFDVGEGKSVKDFVTGKGDQTGDEKRDGAADGAGTADAKAKADTDRQDAADRPSEEEIRKAKLAAADPSHLKGDEGADKVDVAGVPSPSGTANTMSGDSAPDAVAGPPADDAKGESPKSQPTGHTEASKPAASAKDGAKGDGQEARAAARKAKAASGKGQGAKAQAKQKSSEKTPARVSSGSSET